LETRPTRDLNEPQETIPNTPLASATISFLLGIVFTLGLALWVTGPYSLWFTQTQLGFFIACWAAFHWGEFAVTAGWNRDRVSVDSYLLDNGMQYHIANTAAITEFVIESYFFPGLKQHAGLSRIGMVLTLSGQVLRSVAMIHAAANFSHKVAMQRDSSHKLVTDGIYSWFRHPSYTGFFYWGLGTQMTLQNPVCFVGYGVVLWRFFNYRIRAEEWALIRFFGDDYRAYKKRVGVYIPFIKGYN
jgi:protein-S-isoprenylcysteine O-methyltransferase